MSSKPRMWSAWPWVRMMASRRSTPARRACWRKSGVVSMTTFWLWRPRSREGRRRLSWGSLELQTRQWQLSVGTPMEVPEPRTVIFMGADGIGAFASLGEFGWLGGNRESGVKPPHSKFTGALWLCCPARLVGLAWRWLG